MALRDLLSFLSDTLSLSQTPSETIGQNSSYRDLIAVSKIINKLDPVTGPRDDAFTISPHRGYEFLSKEIQHV